MASFACSHAQGVENDPEALKACTAPGVLDWLRNANETLAKTQKRVEDHLETKRQAFPRFCFLSNDELLEILAQARLDCLLIAS